MLAVSLLHSSLHGSEIARTDMRLAQLPAPDTKDQSDFSFLLHQSGAGDLALKLAARHPHATIVTHEANSDLALRHALAASERNITNTFIGNPQTSSFDASHDTIGKLPLRS